MARRLFLPLASGAPGRLPTVDAVRKQLGGRASTEPGAGELVTLLPAEWGNERVGVVLFVHGDDLDVWLDGGLVRRVRRASTRPAGAESRAGSTAELLTIAQAARVFGDLGEGERVVYPQEDGMAEGALVEKCRFGALVERADGTVVGVGFRRLAAHRG